MRVERESVRGKKSVSLSNKKPSVRALARQSDIRFFYRFVQRYDLREKALEILSARLRQKQAH